MNVHTILFVLLAAWTTPLFPASISIQPISSSVSPGDSIFIAIDANTVSNLYAFQFDLHFVPGSLSATGITEGPLLRQGGSTFFINGSIDNASGVISQIADTLEGPIAGVTGTGTLATIQLTALSAAGTSAILLSNLTLLDSNLSEMAVTTTGASVTITTVPEPSAALLLMTSLAAFALVSAFLRPLSQ